MSNFLITLTPLDKFFFGGDMTFKVQGDEAHNDKFGSYIIESSMFPQQTSLLGMLRFLLLSNDPALFDGKGIIPGQSAAVAELIGGSSFQVRNDGMDALAFGRIKKLHRCFVRCTDAGGVAHSLDFLGFDHQFGGKTLSAEKYGYVNGVKVLIPELVGYSAKVGYEKLLSDGTLTKSLYDIFAQDRRVGIQRDIKTGKTDDGSLFKQISYRFKEDDGCRYCFAFYLEADAEMERFNGQIVSVGADNSQFVFKAEKVGEIKRDAAPEGLRLVLKSPAFLDKKTVAMAAATFTETMPFRFLKTSVGSTVNYSVVPRTVNGVKHSAPARSRKYELYASGSVFYFKDKQSLDGFIEGLKSYEGFRQIGYNEF